MCFERPYWRQILFVGDTLAPILFDSVDESEKKITVIGFHTSKSCRCPVYRIDAKGFVIIARYNFYNWNVTVISEKVLNVPMLDQLVSGNHLFFEGMEDYKRPPWENGMAEFSFMTPTHYTLFTAMFLIANAVKASK